MMELKEYDLSGRAAVVTGGGTGIGEASAKLLAKAGAMVMITGRRKEKLEKVQKEIREEGGICEIFVGDISSEDVCRELISHCAEVLGAPAILVNNAGTSGTAHSLEGEFDTELYRKTMAVDLDSIVWLIKYFYPGCPRETGGSIVNICSIAALKGTGHVAYTAAKGAVRSMTRVLARKLGPEHVRINSVYPGLIQTEMTQKAVENEAFVESQKKNTPVGRIGQPEDIAQCVLYLASDASSFVTGQDFVVDGGYTC